MLFDPYLRTRLYMTIFDRTMAIVSPEWAWSLQIDLNTQKTKGYNQYYLKQILKQRTPTIKSFQIKKDTRKRVKFSTDIYIHTLNYSPSELKLGALELLIMVPSGHKHRIVKPKLNLLVNVT